MPLASGGYFDVPGAGGTRRVRVRRAHLEEDAGKNIHDAGGQTLVDLNRAGTPLLEIVTEPDLTSADEAYTFCTELQRLVTYLGVSEGNMKKGQMRFEPNVNVVIESNGTEYRTPISEIKNLNSFRAVRDAIEYESERQVDAWTQDRGYVLGQAPNENRGWNADRGITEFQRGKEAAHDYRYFPDPDLVPVRTGEAAIAALADTMPELPLARRARLQERCGLTRQDADTIVSDLPTADLFDAMIDAGAPAATAVKQFVNVWQALANARGRTVAALGISASRMARLATMVDARAINKTAANTIAEVMLTRAEDPEVLAQELGLTQVRDAAATEAWVDQALATNEQAVKDAVENPKKAKAAIGFLRGQVMKLSGGKADPKLVGALIEKCLEARKGG